jgi:hypothetical protein
MTHSRSISVLLADGSKVTVQALLTNPDAVITEADEAAIRACIEAISERRMDPQRQDRRRDPKRATRPNDPNAPDSEDGGGATP